MSLGLPDNSLAKKIITDGPRVAREAVRVIQRGLTDDGALDILRKLVELAGFQVTAIRRYHHRDASRENPVSNISVRGENGPNDGAIRWVEAVYSAVLAHLNESEAIGELVTLLEYRLPLTPIVISSYGDLAVESDDISLAKTLERRTRDGDIIASAHLLHQACGKPLAYMPVSDRFQALVCRHCCARFEFSISLTQLHDLRQHFTPNST